MLSARYLRSAVDFHFYFFPALYTLAFYILTTATDKLSLAAAARTAKYGLLFGLVYGGVQDVVGLARGRPVSYVEAVRRRVGRPSAGQPETA